MTIMCWFMAWTPYLTLSFLGIFSDRTWLTPMSSVWGAIFAKASACYNPLVYGISHPKYRAALYEKFNCVACKPDGGSKGDASTTASEVDKSGEWNVTMHPSKTNWLKIKKETVLLKNKQSCKTSSSFIDKSTLGIVSLLSSILVNAKK